jgi:hypothetical protein
LGVGVYVPVQEDEAWEITNRSEKQVLDFNGSRFTISYNDHRLGIILIGKVRPVSYKLGPYFSNYV